jgi:hypothetical protein
VWFAAAKVRMLIRAEPQTIACSIYKNKKRNCTQIVLRHGLSDCATSQHKIRDNIEKEKWNKMIQGEKRKTIISVPT